MSTAEIYQISDIQNTVNYTEIEEQITAKGYENPLIDTGDCRQRKIWSYIKKHNLGVKIENVKGMCGSLAPKNDKNYKYFQCRIESESEEKIKEYIEEFFLEKKKLKRLPFVFKINNLYYPAVGNHRIKAITSGLNQYGDDSFTGHYILIDPCDRLTEDEKVLHGSQIAILSNRDTGNETQRESAEDISHQMKSQFDLLMRSRPELKNYTDLQKIKWAEDWAEKYKPNTSKRIKSIAKNKAFAGHISQVIDFPKEEEIDMQWQLYWPGENWEPSVVTGCRQEIYTTHQGNFQKVMMTDFLNRKKFTSDRDEIEICVRVGQTLAAKITDADNIKNGRESFIAFLQKWNLNVNTIGGGFPMITKVLFVKQTCDGDYEAWKWSDSENEFVEVKTNK